MNGGITLDDGTYVPYTYIWDKRKDLQKIQTITDNSILTEKKIEIHGGEDEFNQYIADNAYIYLDEPEEIEVIQCELSKVDTLIQEKKNNMESRAIACVYLFQNHINLKND